MSPFSVSAERLPVLPGIIVACLLMSPGFVRGEVAAEESPQSPPDAGFHEFDPQLGALIAMLLGEHPRIEAERALRMSMLERVSQARSFPDPVLSYRLFAQSPETRVGPQRHGLEISQGIPWTGKRKLQALRAEQLAGRAAWQIRDLERARVAELKQAYFEAAYLQEALAVNADEATLLQRFESIALTRYSTGEGGQQSVIRVQTDISRLADRRILLLERFDAARLRLTRSIGRSDSDLELRPVRLHLLDLRLDRRAMEREAVQAHPRVRAAEARIDADRSWSRRSSLETRPDFRVGLGYVEVGRRDDPAGRANPPEDNGQDVLSFTVALDLPLQRSRIRAGIREAEQSRRSNEYLLEDTRDRLRFEVAESILAIESIDERARLYDEVIIPQAEQSLASSEAAYTTNRQDVLDLLDAQRILFQARLTYHRLLADYWIALADLELAMGRPFPVERSGS